MAELKITQVRSTIGARWKQRESLRTLGLRKIRQSVVREDNAQTRGLIRPWSTTSSKSKRSDRMTIKLHDLRPAPGSKTAKTRVGRGEGSKGKTAGRGTKGTKARKNVPATFEGGQMPIHMRLPKLKGFKNRFRTEYEVVNVGDINKLFPKGGDVGVDELVAAGAVRKNSLVKVLGDGKLTVKVNVTAHKFSGAAREKITAAGGSATELLIREKRAARTPRACGARFAFAGLLGYCRHSKQPTPGTQPPPPQGPPLPQTPAAVQPPPPPGPPEPQVPSAVHPPPPPGPPPTARTLCKLSDRCTCRHREGICGSHRCRGDRRRGRSRHDQRGDEFQFRHHISGLPLQHELKPPKF